MSVVSFSFRGADVRTVTLANGEPGFVGKDVAARLGYEDATTAIRSHCRGVQILHPIPDAIGRMQQTRILTEPDVLRLIVSSHLPEAVEFERWVFEEVLPSLRKAGAYAMPAAVAQAPAYGVSKPVEAMTPKAIEEEVAAAARVMSDDRLKALFPLVWQDIADGVQNALLRVVASSPSTLALPSPSGAKLLDVVEIAKAAGIDLPSNLKGAAGKYVKARVPSVETERLINGSIRKSYAYSDHDAVAAAIREYLAGKK